MPSRRRFLTSLIAALVASPFGGLAPRARAAGTGRFHIVNGWILTDADLEVLRRHDR
jgi:hypothetical protein